MIACYWLKGKGKANARGIPEEEKLHSQMVTFVLATSSSRERKPCHMNCLTTQPQRETLESRLLNSECIQSSCGVLFNNLPEAMFINKVLLRN